MITFLRGIMGIAAFTLTAFIYHAAIGAGSDDGGATFHAIPVDANVDDTMSIPDFDNDGTIGFGDFLKFAAKFGLGQGDDGYDAQYDLNGDGAIGFTDFLILAENFGKAAAASPGEEGGAAESRDWRFVVFHSFKVSDASLTAGQPFTMETTLQKRVADQGIVDLVYFRSLDATIDASDAFIHHGDWRLVDPQTTAIQTVALDWTAPSYAGVYYYGVCEDLYQNYGRCSGGVRVTVEGSEDGSPDAAIFPPHVSHRSVTPGSRFTWRVRIENIGTGTAAPTSLRYYLSDDATIDANDSLAHIFSIPHRKPGTAAVNSFTSEAPAVEGTYYVGFCVDPVPAETNIENNCSVGLPLIVESGSEGSPDLIVRSGTFKTPNRTREFFTILSHVVNLGSRASDGTVVRLYRSDGATVNAIDTPGGTYDIGSVAVETSANAWVSSLVPSNPGTYHFTACVDPVPGESNTDNNCSETVPVSVGVPDLAVGLVWPGTSALVVDASFTLTATVRNHGPEAAGSTTLRYYRSDDAIIDGTDTQLGTADVRSLMGVSGLYGGPENRPAASGTRRESIGVSAPPIPGTYYYGACVDPVPAETNTDNNCSTGAYVRVLPFGEDPFNIDLVFVGDFTDAHKDVMQQAARRWENIITQGLPDVDFSTNEFDIVDYNGRVRTSVSDTVDDLRIFIFKSSLGGPVGQGGPAFVRAGAPNGLPALGGIWIDESFIARRARESLHQEERIMHDLMLHETAHALGFGTLWGNRDLVHEPSGDTYFSGALAIEAFNAAGGEDYRGNKVPLESGYLGGGCGSGAHWNPYVFRGLDREFGAELMEPTIEKEHALSAITLQSFADLGYVVDVSRANPYRLPASVSTAQPPTAGAKPVASYGDRDLGVHGTIHIGDEHGNVIRTIEP